MKYDALRMIISRAKNKAGVTKRTNLHAFRHYKATALASLGLNETIQSEIMGWTLGTKMTKVYSHLSGKQVDDAYLQAMGLKSKTGDDQTTLRCHHCQYTNNMGQEFCQNCKLPVTLSAGVTVMNNEMKLSALIQDLEKKTEFFERLERNIAKLSPEIKKQIVA